MLRRITILLSALTLTLGIAAPAQAGGSGNFYKHWTCKPPLGGSATANLDVTNYPYGTGQRYHIDIDAGGLRVNGLFFNGVKQGDWDDVYVYRENETSINTITASWFYGPYLLASTTTCTVKG